MRNNFVGTGIPEYINTGAIMYEYGWPRQLIKKYLPKPDAVVTVTRLGNEEYQMPLYKRETVQAAMHSSTFTAAVSALATCRKLGIETRIIR